MTYCKKELIDELRRVSEEHCDGEAPRTKDIRKHSHISRNAFYSHYDIWEEVLKEAGFNNSRSEISKEKLSKEIKRVSEKYCGGKPPKIDDLNKHGHFSVAPYYNYWDSWNEALNSVGFEEYNRKREYSREELIENIKQLSQNHLDGKTPRQKDMRSYGISTTIYENNFGSWSNALKLAGFEPWNPTGQNNPNWKGGIKRYYGPNWIEQKKKALQRDGYSCRICGKNEEDIGRKPSIHHITPSRYWKVDKEYKIMNSLKNLISLCINCHQKIEGKFKGRSHEDFERLAKQYLS